MIKKLILLFLLTVLSLSAYSDYDMDGVDDKNDKCPNTLLSELVNRDGCAVKNLNSYHHFDIIYGFDFYQTSYTTLENSDTLSQSLQLDYYYKNFSIQLSSSYYNSTTASFNDSGVNDSFAGVYYKINTNSNLKIRLGTGAIIPTYESELNNNNTDYTASVSLSYLYDDFNLFGAYSYTLVNDNDITEEGVLYQDTNAYTLGLGFYPSDRLYLSAAYSSSNSIYQGVADIDTSSIYGLYNINKHWFATLNYAYGISESASDNFASLRLGYYF